MAKKVLNIAVSELPHTEVIKTDNDDNKVIIIKQMGINQDITVDVYCSLDGINAIPVIEKHGGGQSTKGGIMILLKEGEPSSGTIIENCPVPYIHLVFKNINNATTGMISWVQVN